MCRRCLMILYTLHNKKVHSFGQWDREKKVIVPKGIFHGSGINTQYESNKKRSPHTSITFEHISRLGSIIIFSHHISADPLKQSREIDALWSRPAASARPQRRAPHNIYIITRVQFIFGIFACILDCHHALHFSAADLGFGLCCDESKIAHIRVWIRRIFEKTLNWRLQIDLDVCECVRRRRRFLWYRQIGLDVSLIVYSERMYIGKNINGVYMD